MTPTLNIQQAADLMKVHPKTVLDRINDGTLPAGRMGRAYVLMTKDVLAYIEAVIVKQTQDRIGGKVTRAYRRVKTPAGSCNA